VASRKNIKNIFYFVCDNGLGHIERSIRISNYLSKTYRINLLSDVKKIKKFKLRKKINISNLKYKNYKNFFIKLKNADIILSDNYLNPVILRNNFIIYANFFWHEILKKRNKRLNLYLELLKKKKINIFGNYLFQNIKEKKIIKKKIGFIGKFEGKIKYNKNILISLGTAKIDKKIKNKMIKQIEQILLNNNNNDYNYFFDKNYYKFFKKFKNTYLADFSEKMLKKVCYCICKPGFSSINNSLRFGTILISLNYKFNKEFFFNNKIIKKYKLGYVAKNFNQAQIHIEKISKNLKLKESFFDRYKNLIWEGEKRIKEKLDKF